MVALLHAVIRQAILDAADRITAEKGAMPTATEAAAVVAACWSALSRAQGHPPAFVDALVESIHAVGDQLAAQLAAELN